MRANGDDADDRSASVEHSGCEWHKLFVEFAADVVTRLDSSNQNVKKLESIAESADCKKNNDPREG